MACSGVNVIFFKQAFSPELQPQKQIEMPGWATRMGLINGDIWIPIRNNKTIQVINQEAALVKIIAHHHNPHSVIQASNGDIILGSDSGLEIIDKDGKVLKRLKRGKFCDISMDGDKFAALDCSRREISVWQCGFGWKLCSQSSCFKVTNGNMESMATVLYFNNTVYCVSDPFSNKIDEYTADGKFTKQHTPPNGSFIYLCAHDNEGQFITASFWNSCFILYQNGGFTILPSSNVQQPRDVVCMPDGDCVWIIQGWNPLRLVKYTIK